MDEMDMSFGGLSRLVRSAGQHRLLDRPVLGQQLSGNRLSMVEQVGNVFMDVAGQHVEQPGHQVRQHGIVGGVGNAKVKRHVSPHGQVTAVSVIFDHPTATGSAVTLTATATVSFGTGLAEAEATLSAGPLAGWRASPGDGSIMYSGGIGARWVVSSGEATLTATGRLLS